METKLVWTTFALRCGCHIHTAKLLRLGGHFRARELD
jgi:hypothetical protein